MIIFYNLLQLLCIAILWPVLLAFVLVVPKYRGRIARRLFAPGLAGVDHLPAGGRIWVHALSVGEVRSAAMMIRALREAFPGASIILSLSTAGGEKLARAELSGLVDLIIPFPLDFYPSVRLWLGRIRPDLFIQVETDFWPNFLYLLAKKQIPSLLVNGRISAGSLSGYSLFKGEIRRLLASFKKICVANEADAEGFLSLGVEAETVRVIGNLKYDAPATSPASDGPAARMRARHPDEAVFIIASTHPGEEELALDACRRLRKEGISFYPVIAPRDPGRGGEVAAIASAAGFSAGLRSRDQYDGDLLILDSLGELSSIFATGDLAFIGGSLVPCRGHNPLEAAVCGVPVLFGPSMEDFSDIARDLVKGGGGFQVNGSAELFRIAGELLTDDAARKRASKAARSLVDDNSGVVGKVVALARELWPGGARS